MTSSLLIFWSFSLRHSLASQNWNVERFSVADRPVKKPFSFIVEGSYFIFSSTSDSCIYLSPRSRQSSYILSICITPCYFSVSFHLFSSHSHVFALCFRINTLPYLNPFASFVRDSSNEYPNQKRWDVPRQWYMRSDERYGDSLIYLRILIFTIPVPVVVFHVSAFTAILCFG